MVKSSRAHSATSLQTADPEHSTVFALTELTDGGNDDHPIRSQSFQTASASKAFPRHTIYFAKAHAKCIKGRGLNCAEHG